LHGLQAVALASLLCLLRHRWRQLSGSQVQPLASSAAAGAGAGLGSGGNSNPLAQLHQQLHQSAAAAAAAAGGGGGGAAAPGGVGPAAIAQVVRLLEEDLVGAALGQSVLAAADVRLVLEELYELQVNLGRNLGRNLGGY
jgi:hypothetical protein